MYFHIKDNIWFKKNFLQMEYRKKIANGKLDIIMPLI